jgi:hypothetical protein
MQNAKSTIIFAAAAALAVSAVAFADTPGRHPHYLRARTDLRTVQFLLRVEAEPNVMRHVHDVDREIDMAVAEIDRASVIDHKDIQDHPRIDRSLDRRGRFNKAMALLKSARADIAREEDNPRAAGWRDTAYRHIDAAMDQLRRAAHDLRIDHLEGY